MLKLKVSNPTFLSVAFQLVRDARILSRAFHNIFCGRVAGVGSSAQALIVLLDLLGDCLVQDILVHNFSDRTSAISGPRVKPTAHARLHRLVHLTHVRLLLLKSLVGRGLVLPELGVAVAREQAHDRVLSDLADTCLLDVQAQSYGVRDVWMLGTLLIRDHGAAEVLQPLLTIVELHVEEVVEEHEDVSLCLLLIDSHPDLLGVRSTNLITNLMVDLPFVRLADEVIATTTAISIWGRRGSGSCAHHDGRAHLRSTKSNGGERVSAEARRLSYASHDHATYCRTTPIRPVRACVVR